MKLPRVPADTFVRSPWLELLLGWDLLSVIALPHSLVLEYRSSSLTMGLELPLLCALQHEFWHTALKVSQPGYVVDALWLSTAMSQDFNLPSQGMLVLHLASRAQTTSVLCYPKPMLLMHPPPVESQSLQWVPTNQTPVPWKIYTYPFLRHQCQQGQTLC